jgi:hypothetical protein
MSGLGFTEEAARQLEALYLTSDVIAQRSETLSQLQLIEGENIIDIRPMKCRAGPAVRTPALKVVFVIVKVLQLLFWASPSCTSHFRRF